jgi:hypothetical protein
MVSILIPTAIFVYYSAYLKVDKYKMQNANRWNDIRNKLEIDTYFIAVNLFNSSSVLHSFIPELKQLIVALGTDKCFVSIWENGSSDGTKVMLKRLQYDLDAMKVKNKIVTTNATIIQLCNEAGLSSCSLAEFANGVRHTVATTRIKMMALFRNKPLQPLYNYLEYNGTIYDLFPYISETNVNTINTRFKTNVFFFNDILFSYKDAIKLLRTNKMNYDLACALDFHFINLYDLWVLRDINGLVVSPTFPYFWDYNSFWRLCFGQPVRVYSCWNGLVVFDASVLLTKTNRRDLNRSKLGIKFRTWNHKEKRAPKPKINLTYEEMKIFENSVFGAECPVSECQLFSKDLWDAGRTNIYVNPLVKVDYNPYYRLLRQLLAPITNTVTFIFWVIGHHSKHLIYHKAPGEAVRAPLEIKCGIDYAKEN